MSDCHKSSCSPGGVGPECRVTVAAGPCRQEPGREVVTEAVLSGTKKAPTCRITHIRSLAALTVRVTEKKERREGERRKERERWREMERWRGMERGRESKTI